jgi:hypothetical protein
MTCGNADDTGGYQEEGRQYATPRGTPQGGVILPLPQLKLRLRDNLGYGLTKSVRLAVGV